MDVARPCSPHPLQPRWPAPVTYNGNGTVYILRLATPDGKPYVPPDLK